VTRFGIALPTGGPGGPPFAAQSLAEAARNIEAAGFESAWAFDAIGRGFLHPDPLTALAVAAGVTRTIEVGTGVLQVPLRNPVELAQRALTTHLVSGGRFRFGVGAGSTAADFAALGQDFAARPDARRVAGHHAPALERRARRGGLAGARLAGGAGRPAHLHRLLGGLALDPAGGQGVRRLDRLGCAQ
jgi:alkanesulfonate monooxygenase SsuD/methylene tetrahydromethanopterin reductase-like flavin-dependent oxidoreductase (luciferase family)